MNAAEPNAGDVEALAKDGRGRTSSCLPFCQGGLHEQGCPLLTATRDSCTHRWHDGRDPGPCPGCGYLRPRDGGGVEALARWLHNAGDGGCWEHFDLDSSRIVAAGLIASDWLDAVRRKAASDALSEAADDWPEDGMTRAEAQRWLAARIARGGA